MEIVLSLLFKLGPYIVLVLSALGVYFGVKRKGVREERERQETKAAEVKKRVEAKVEKAVAKDEAVDVKIAAKVKEIEVKKPIPVDPPDKFRF